MIGKTVIGKTFAGCIRYNLSKVEKGEGEILECRGVRDFDLKAMIRDFDFRSMANPKLSRKVWHTSLSFQDKVDNNQMLAITKQWMKGMGLDQTQYVIVRHTDQAHDHVHIVANRINDDGKTISDSNNWKRSEAICNALIKEFQLTPVPGERNEARINRDKLRGRDLLKTDLNRVIKNVLSKSKSFEEFSNGMREKGFICMIKFNPDNSVRGVSFERDGITIKGSDIHKSLSARNIAEIIELNRIRNIDQKLDSIKQQSALPGKNHIPRLNKFGKELDTSDDDEKKRNKRSDFDIGI